MTTALRYAGATYRVAQAVQRVAVFDFDGTLFRSPEKPPGWKGAWWTAAPSLEPPCVPEIPTEEWWNEAVVVEARDAIEQSDTWAVLMTGRATDPFEPRVLELLATIELEFDEVLTNTAGPRWTRQWKERQLKRLVREHEPSQVALWDDRVEHLDKFVPLLRDLGVRVTSQLVEITPMQPVCEGNP